MIRMPRLPLRVLPLVLFAHYLLFGVQLGFTGVLWSEVRQRLGLGDGAFGLVLLATPMVGFLLLSAGAIVRERFNRRSLAAAGLICSTVGLVGVALAPNLGILLGARLLCGLGYGLNDAAVMGAALAWERGGKRSLVGRLYAGFSLGAVCGALLSGWLLNMGWSYSAILLTAAPLGLLLAGIAACAAYDHGSAPDRQSAARPIPWSSALIALALLSLCSSLVEALLAGWLVIHLRALGAGPLAASSAYAASDVALILGRLVAPGLQQKFGATRAFLAAAALIIVGASVIAGSAVAGSAAAFVIIGVGVAVIAPIVLALGQTIAPHASDAVARMLLAAGYLGFLIAGPLAGVLAGLLSVQRMLVGSLVMLGVLIGALALPARRRSFVRPGAPALHHYRTAEHVVQAAAAIVDQHGEKPRVQHQR